MVTVIGEAGIGKSRAIAALQEVIASEPKTRIHLQCSPHHNESALYPLIRHLIRAARIAPADPPGARIEKLRALVADRAASDPAAIPLLAELLSIATRHRIRCRCLQHSARRRPSPCWSTKSSGSPKRIRCCLLSKTPIGSMPPRSNC